MFFERRLFLSTYSVLVIVVNLATKTVLVVDLVLQGEGVVLKAVTGLDALASCLVLLSVLLGLLDHTLDFLGAEATLVVGDGNALALTGALVTSADLEDTVGIKLERDLDLRNTTGSGRDTGKLELAELVVILGHGTFTLEDLDQDNGLVISGGREDLGLLGRDGSATLDQVGHDTTSGLNTESKRVDIHQDNLAGLGLTRQNTTLDSGTVGDGLVRVDTLAGLLSEELLEHGLNLGNTSGTTNKDNIIDVALLELGVLEDLLNGLESLLEEVIVELLELGAGQSLGEVGALEEGLDFDASAHLGRESTLGLFDLTLQLTHGLEVLGDVDVVLLVVGLDKVVDNSLIEVLTTEMGVTGSSLDLEDTVVDSQDGNIESTTTEIVDDDLAFLVGLVQTVGEGGGGGLVDDTENVETGDGTSVLGGGTLGIVEVGGDGDDGVGDLLAEVRLGDFLHLAQNHGADLLGGESLLTTVHAMSVLVSHGLFGCDLLLNLDLDSRLAALVDDLEGEVLHVTLNILVVELASDQTLDVVDGSLGVGCVLVLGCADCQRVYVKG